MKQKRLPTLEQIEEILSTWDCCAPQDLARKFGLDIDVVEETICCLRRLKRSAVDVADLSEFLCPRDCTLEDLVKCVGARHGYIMGA